MTRWKAIATALAAALLSGTLQAQPTGFKSTFAFVQPLQGRVYEVDADGRRPPLAAVDIWLRRSDGTYLSRDEHVTDARGEFRISLTAKQADELKGGRIEFRLKPYYDDPESRPLMPSSGRLPDVGMFRSGRDPKFYAAAMKQVAALPPGSDRSALLATAAALPAPERAAVRAALSANDLNPLLKEFSAAENAAVLRLNLGTELRKRNFDGTVFLQTNQPSLGKVFVGGSVRDPKELKDLRDITGSVDAGSVVDSVRVRPGIGMQTPK